ncbi:MAG: FadR family transcriptional regulator [Clostridia bacterium]|nr:FadR family transcriptional regulator [Clostridia bacterium]
MKFETIKKTRVYEEVVKQIKELIMEGKLDSGERLPSERELAKQFGVSRVSVRQALTVLETLGLIERKVGGGTFNVTKISDFDVDPIVEAILKKRDQLNQPLEMRRMLEPNLARLAAKRAKDDNIRELEGSLKTQRKLLDEGELIIEEDVRFHYLIAKATNNDIAVKIVEVVHEFLQQTREKSIKARQGGELSYRGHTLILRAIKKRDEDRAYEAMMDHLEEVEALILTHIAEFGE